MRTQRAGSPARRSWRLPGRTGSSSSAAMMMHTAARCSQEPAHPLKPGGILKAALRCDPPGPKSCSTQGSAVFSLLSYTGLKPQLMHLQASSLRVSRPHAQQAAGLARSRTRRAALCGPADAHGEDLAWVGIRQGGPARKDACRQGSTQRSAHRHRRQQRNQPARRARQGMHRHLTCDCFCQGAPQRVCIQVCRGDACSRRQPMEMRRRDGNRPSRLHNSTGEAMPEAQHLQTG